MEVRRLVPSRSRQIAAREELRAARDIQPRDALGCASETFSSRSAMACNAWVRCWVFSFDIHVSRTFLCTISPGLPRQPAIQMMSPVGGTFSTGSSKSDDGPEVGIISDLVSIFVNTLRGITCTIVGLSPHPAMQMITLLSGCAASKVHELVLIRRDVVELLILDRRPLALPRQGRRRSAAIESVRALPLRQLGASTGPASAQLAGAVSAADSATGADLIGSRSDFEPVPVRNLGAGRGSVVTDG